MGIYSKRIERVLSQQLPAGRLWAISSSRVGCRTTRLSPKDQVHQALWDSVCQPMLRAPVGWKRELPNWAAVTTLNWSLGVSGSWMEKQSRAWSWRAPSWGAENLPLEFLGGCWEQGTLEIAGLEIKLLSPPSPHYSPACTSPPLQGSGS